MAVQDKYDDALRRSREGWAEATDAWTQTAQQAVRQVPTTPFTPFTPFTPVDPHAMIDQAFEFANRVLEANRAYVKNLAEAASAITGAVRQHVGDLNTAVRESAESVAHTVEAKVEDAVETARDELTSKYDELSRAELQTKLEELQLPKTGTTADLRQRLAAAELQS